jgi:hypothetical protein
MEPKTETKAKLGYKEKSVKEKVFSINVAAARHEIQLLKEIITEFKFEEVTGKNKKADMYWQFPLT